MLSEDASKAGFFEAAIVQAKKEFEADGKNAQALVRWGGALLELAHFKQGQESLDMIQQAIAKLKQALELEPERPDAEWCLGNAYTSLGFLCEDKPKAMEQFKNASDCFKRCQAREPKNDTYQRALEMCEKAPVYYDEIQAHLQAQKFAEAQGARSGGLGGAGAGGSGAADSIWWDVGGWVLLGAVIVGAVVIARNSGPKTA